jgi:hypothetical protein
MVCRDAELGEAVRAMIGEVEGKPCVNLGDCDGGVYACRRLSGREIDDESLDGTCEWAGPEDARPDELTDGMRISCGCVRLGPGRFQDTFFRRYFVHEPGLVARSMAGDHSWARASPGAEGAEV